jgi:putative membrane protein
MLISLILGLLIGAVAVVFALQNITRITVTFLTWQINGSLALILVLALLAGILISLLISIPEVIKNSFTISGLRKQNKKLNDDLEASHKKIAELEGRLPQPASASQGANSSV